MAAIREARTIWEGDLTSGKGTVTAVSSGLFTDLGVSWAARNSEKAGGLTSPEELLAAAHASCFSMALSSGLAKAGTPPTKLEVTAAVTFDAGVKKSAVRVRGWVPGSDRATFARLAEEAKDGCPISKALKGNVELAVSAELVA
jgi:osmotically inducible protein OsmC